MGEETGGQYVGTGGLYRVHNETPSINVNKHPQYVCWKSDYLAMQLSMLFRLQIYTNTYTHKAFDGGYYTFPNHEVDVYTLGGDLVFFGFCTPSFSTLSACKQNKQQTSPSKLSLPVNKLINKSA